ncbi:MAG TPA: uroporphyrinogen decarboxylase family protein, partial [Anaerolineales bacterium]
GVYDEYACYPLAEARTRADVDRYAYWPKAEYWDVSGIPAQIASLNRETEYHLRYEIGGIFESAWGLFGLERFLVSMASGEMDAPGAALERYTDLFISNTCRVLHAAGGEIDMVYVFDDIGTQRGPLISVPMWRKYILPHHRRLMAAIRQFPVRVMYHSCGAIYPFIASLVAELGIDVLNPLQPRAAGMDLARIKAEFGSRLAFHGGIDLQDTLPNASPDQVQREVAETCRLLDQDGGYICTSAHYIQADTPVENVIAMYTAPRS